MPEERKLVTILFADVAGSTALGEELDPEDVRALMGRYYEHARRVVELHGGTLEKFIGDAVMAVFGLPSAHGDDAERAVAAAMALRGSIGADDLLASRLSIRIGVNTGEVVATTDSERNDFLVTGDAVNVAARLQQSASPGEIVVGERTYAATRMVFAFLSPRRVEVKGKAAPLAIYPVTGPLAEKLSGRPALIGRKQDLALLGLLRDRALEERRPQLVSIVAPAGTGKTRLLEEFLGQLDRADGFKVGTAKCLPYGQTLAYWPLRGLLQSLLQCDLADDRSGVALYQAFAAVAQPDDARRLAEHVLASLGVELNGAAALQTERESVFNAWRLLVEALAQESPLIVVFEDLHWASDSLLDLVEHIMHPRTQAPLVIIGLSRPELLDRRPGWGGGRGNFSSLAMEPLSEAQTARLIGAAGSDLPPAIQDKIVERSGGNPFFALELVRGLAERGIGAGGSMPAEYRTILPDTVHAAVLARLDLLSPLQRRVVQAASVLGRTFQAASLAPLLEDVTPTEIDGTVDALLSRDLITPAESDSFTFRHILTRDVAYGTLSRVERVRMHTAVASWLEGFAADRVDEFVELIAYHYHEAATLSRRAAVSTHAPVATERAIQYLSRAGRQVALSGAFVEATAYLRNAIELASEDEKGALYEDMGDVAAFGDSGIAAYREALNRWRQVADADPLVGARILRKMIVIYTRWMGSVTDRPTEPELSQLRAEAMGLAEAVGDLDEVWRLRATDLFLPFWRSGVTPTEAALLLETADEAADYFSSRSEWDMVHTVLDGHQGIAREIGDHKSRLEVAKRRLTLPQGSPLERGDATSMMAWAYMDDGQYDAAIQFMATALGDLGAGEPVAHFSNGISLAAYAAMLCGRWHDVDRFVPHLSQAWDELRHDRSAGFLAFGFGAALHVALAREDQPKIDAAAAALRSITSAGQRRMQLRVLDAYLQDDASLLQGSLNGVTANSGFISVGFALCLERGVVPSPDILDVARTVRATTKVRFISHYLSVSEGLEAGDPQRLKDAIDAAEISGLVPFAARTRIALAAMSGRIEPLRQAKPVLQRLDDRQFLLRLEEVGANLAPPRRQPRRIVAPFARDR